MSSDIEFPWTGAARLDDYSQHACKHRALSKRMIRWGVGDANWVLSMYDESLGFLRYAKERGLKIAIDVFISPCSGRIMNTLFRRFSSWEGTGPRHDFGRHEDHMREIFSLADIVICPSKWVEQGVCELDPRSEEKVRVVAYGCSVRNTNFGNQPERGRILYCGRDHLRKGLPDLARSAKELKARHPSWDFRVAGKAPAHIMNLPECSGLTFLGDLDSDEMVAEYRQADIFVLPTYSEGLAGAAVEALTFGIPIITTPACGLNLRSGEEGFLVQPGDVNALTQSIEAIVTDRNRRKAMGESARNSSAYYTADAWAKRLVAVFDES
ncbi:glycosyltransferase family 4 protein [Akkermansiaceae bacterium]|nr:glycosyltransferase family 4 protein [Akkermansiaceae bacterium]MDB4636726.1 glycosyltransferase family 4 protein [Akkermansiaceae bacterium]